MLETDRGISQIDAVVSNSENTGIKRGVGIDDDVSVSKDLEGFIGHDITKRTDFPLMVIAIGTLAIKEKITHGGIMPPEAPSEMHSEGKQYEPRRR